MSVVSDANFLIHNLRLNYLRHVEDPYGPRLIALSPSPASNPYIAAARMADDNRWPELSMPVSPHVSDDEDDDKRGRGGGGSGGDGRGAPSTSMRSQSGYPGARGLQYTQTIMGPSRVGAVGMSVRGRRGPLSRLSRQIPPAVAAAAVSIGSTPNSPIVIPATAQDGTDPAAPQPPPPLAQPAQPAPYVPKFRGAAEMDARRRLRLQARRGAAPAPAPSPQPNRSQTITRGIDSSSSSSSSDADEEEDDFDVVDGAGSLDIDGDEEFDTEFATVNMLGATDDSADGLSVLSISNSASLSMPTASVLSASLSASAIAKRAVRLSPVKESAGARRRDSLAVDDGDEEPLFEMVSPPPPPARKSRRPSASTPADDLFARVKPPPPIRGRSALSARLAEETATNPFAELYSAISGRGSAAPVPVVVFFPHSRDPLRRMELSVRHDASVEEVLGFALWTYWQEKWEPRMDEVLGEDAGETGVSAVGWVLRIAEEDGEVDEDFPPPDRMGKISKFSFDAYAVLEASPAQIQQNKILEAKIQRSPSRVVKLQKPEPAPLPAAPPPPASIASVPLTSSLVPSSFGHASTLGPQIFLRIRVQEALDAVHVYSTIPVTSNMYLQEALEMVCARRHLPPKDYTLVVGDMSVLVALDRTVNSLAGRSDLLLVKKEMVNNLGVEVAQPAGSSADPNSSIFGSNTDVPEPAVSAISDFTAAYKRFTVYRKLPMLVGRHERILAIDGAYIHFMPSNKAKAVFESGKTSSYHIKSVVACQQVDRSSATFRIVVHRVSRDGGNKRYEFEAESPAVASEIVATIKSMKNSVDRHSTIKARRSKHIG